MKISPHKKNFDTSEIESGFFWRYIDFFHLLSFLKKKEVYFSKANKFDDITECLSDHGFKELSKANSFKSISNLNLIKALGENKIKEGKKVGEDKELKTFKEAIIQQNLNFISCWHFNDRESFAMWEQYSQSKGFAVKVPAKTLFDVLISEAKKKPKLYEDWLFTYGFINYRKLTPYDHHCENNSNYSDKEFRYKAFNKDISYRHEDEFRFVAKANTISDKNKFALSISSLVDECKIIAAPNLKTWEIDMANEAISSFTTMKIEPSKLYTRYQIQSKLGSELVKFNFL